MTKGSGYTGDAAMKRRLVSAFRKILSPQLVNDVRVTHEGAGLVQGFILTNCPIEKRNHLEDFEAHFSGKDGSLLDYAVVAGRRVKLAPGSDRRSKRRQALAEKTQ